MHTYLLSLRFALCQFPSSLPAPDQLSQPACSGPWAARAVGHSSSWQMTSLLWQWEEAAPCCPFIAQRPFRDLLPVQNHHPCPAAGTRRDASRWAGPQEQGCSRGRAVHCSAGIQLTALQRSSTIGMRKGCAGHVSDGSQ